MSLDAPASDSGEPGDASAGPNPPSIVTALSGLALLALLVAVAVRRGLALANADSLLYGLISTEHLTPYYWGQDRLANIVPALAWPIQQVRWNYLVQTVGIAVSFFALIWTFVRFHANRAARPVSWPTAVASATLTSALALVVLNRWGVYTFVLEQQYALSTLLFLVGLVQVTGGSGRRRAVGAAAMITATLLIPSAVLLFPLIAVIRPGAGLVRRTALAGGVSVIAFVMNTVAADLTGDEFAGADAYADFSFRRMWNGFPHAAASIADSTDRVLALLVGSACVVLLVARRRHLDRSLRLAYAVCPVVAVLWVAIFSANAWVEMNVFLFRYYFVAYAAGLLVLAGAVTESCMWVAGRLDGRVAVPRSPVLALTATATAVAVVLSAAVVARTDIPALERGRQLAEIAADQDAEVIVGDYWQAWPAMFAAREQGGELLAASVRSNRIRADIAALATDGPVGALCLSGDVPTCIGDLNVATEMNWAVDTVRSTDPLVVDVAPAG